MCLWEDCPCLLQCPQRSPHSSSEILHPCTLIPDANQWSRKVRIKLQGKSWQRINSSWQSLQIPSNPFNFPQPNGLRQPRTLEGASVPQSSTSHPTQEGQAPWHGAPAGTKISPAPLSAFSVSLPNVTQRVCTGTVGYFPNHLTNAEI